MAHLQLLKGSRPRRFELTGDSILIGRSPECNLVLESGAISRHHALITRDGSDYYIEDLKSRNGTFVNGQRVLEPTLLKENDRIKICDHLFTFHTDKPQQKTAPFKIEVADGPADSTTITSLVDLSSTGTQLTEVNPELKLRAVLEIARNLCNSVQIDDVLPRILDTLFNIFPQADRGFVLLKDQSGRGLIPKAIKSRHKVEEDSVRVSRTIVRKAMEAGQAILSADAATDTQFDMSKSIADFRIHSIMCVPLIAQKDKPLGIIQLHTEDRRRQFTPEDLEVLVSVASIAAVSLENARLHEDLIAQERLRRDMQSARAVQRAFLPRRLPQIPGYEFYAFYESAYSVGGDYYGFFELPGDRLAISLGDVSGKGMQAALLVARLSSDVRFCSLAADDPGKVVAAVNRSLAEAALADKFVTFLYMVLDYKSHTLAIVNAGHMPPLLRKPDGSIEELAEEVAWLPLNVAPADGQFESASIQLGPGDTLVAYTDGVNEAMNPQNELFGFERIHQTLRDGPSRPAEAGPNLVKAVRNFAAGRAQSDDIAVLCFGRLS